MLLYALLGTGMTFLATAFGAAMVFLFKEEIGANTQRVFLGFAAGVMIAASVWSLLIPSIEMSESVLPTVIGFALGCVFLMSLDRIIPHLHVGESKPEGMKSSFRRTTMLILAVTLHNIPEGMAVGLAFAMAGEKGMPIAGAVALTVGMCLQNIPEGAAVALPLRREGLSKFQAFVGGSLSGFVEPVAALVGVLLAQNMIGIMPYALSFSAGAMMYVVVEELIPEAHLGEHSHTGTASVLFGFVLMMVLDVVLG